MFPHQRTRILGAVVAVMLVAAACAGGAASLQQSSAREGAAAVPPMPAASAAPAAPPAQEANDQFAGSGSDASKAAPAQDDSLVVKTGSILADVTDLDAALVKARGAIAGLGGYVSASDQTDKGGQQVAAVTYRVPAARWQDALDAIHALVAKVVTEQTNTVEVTGQVLDLGARIANLRATESALQAIMVKATKISDILAVQQQLTDVQGQIEQLSTQKQHLQDQAAMSSLTVTYQVPVVAVTTAAKGWDPGAEVDQATARLIELGQGLASIVIWLGIVGLPLLLVLAIVLLPLAWIVRRVGARIRPSAPATWDGGTTTPGA
jgi:hypothetical protein